MSVDVVTDLLGEIVEVYEWSHSSPFSLRGRGVVRAVYVANNQLRLLVEHNLGFDSVSYSERTQDGGFETYALDDHRARVVQRCGRCFTWDQKALLVPVYPGEGTEKAWEHKSGEGCKKVGRGG